LYQRRNIIRLRDFDYSNSNYVYFVTICARHLKEPFRNEELAQEVVGVRKGLVEVVEDCNMVVS
jgi:hypothetical protein